MLRAVRVATSCFRSESSRMRSLPTLMRDQAAVDDAWEQGWKPTHDEAVALALNPLESADNLEGTS